MPAPSRIAPSHTISNYHEIEPLLDTLFAHLLGNRAETHTSYGNIVSDDRSMDWIFRFYGDKAGAHRFLELAKSASGCFGEWTEGRFINRTMRHKHGIEGDFWLKALFEAAWDKKEGSSLCADKVRMAKERDGILNYSVLPINPFTASVLLIDQLIVLSDSAPAAETPANNKHSEPKVIVTPPCQLTIRGLANYIGCVETTIRNACDNADPKVTRAKKAGQGREFTPHEVSRIARQRKKSSRFTDAEKRKWNELLQSLNEPQLHEPLQANRKK